MKSYCLKDKKSGKIFRAFFTEQELTQLMSENPHIIECLDCPECLDAPSITLEN